MPVKANSINAQVRSIEEELKAVKTLIGLSSKDKNKKKTFAALKGIWKGKVHFTEEEIKEAEIKIKGF